MITHLLDTSVYSQRLKPLPVEGVVMRWSSLGNAALAIASCCEAELLFGLKKKDSERLWTEYNLYLKDQLTLLPFGYKEAAQYAQIRHELTQRGQPVSDMDMMIAATAISNRLVLATLNIRHFTRISDLRVEDWSD